MYLYRDVLVVGAVSYTPVQGCISGCMVSYVPVQGCISGCMVSYVPV